MPEPTRFNDGAAYEESMGKWTRPAGAVFLDWVAPADGLQWLDVGCGNGAFTELLVERCAPATVHGIDPSDAQLAFARSRPGARLAEFTAGDAMALPFADESCDAAVMALVIFFVPEPAKGVAEMVRVVRPGGIVAAYAWDILGGGFPWEVFWEQSKALGLPSRHPPSVAASRIEAMHALWSGAGLVDVETREITVQRTFADFDEFWAICRKSASSASLSTMTADQIELLKTRIHERLPADASGRITRSARANAVKGRVPV